jgi:hypothetical protein
MPRLEEAVCRGNAARKSCRPHDAADCASRSRLSSFEAMAAPAPLALRPCSHPAAPSRCRPVSCALLPRAAFARQVSVLISPERAAMTVVIANDHGCYPFSGVRQRASNGWRHTSHSIRCGVKSKDRMPGIPNLHPPLNAAACRPARFARGPFGVGDSRSRHAPHSGRSLAT